MKRMSILALSGVLAMASAAGLALGQDAAAPAAKPTAAASALKVGDAAPSLSVEKFVKGEPVTGFEKGRVYVVEFWATWCGPCIAQMPHITALQREYKDRGLTVVGVNVWEDREDPYSDETLKKVQTFVGDMGDRMGYTVAFDGGAKKTDNAFMKAAGRGGIPCAFVIDQKSTVAWIGHPAMMEPVLEDVIAGKWDTATSPKKIDDAYKAFGKAGKLAETDAKAAVEAWAQAEKDFPLVAKAVLDRKFHAFLDAKQFETAYAAGALLVDKAIARKDSMALNDVAWTIVDPEGQVDNRNYDLAMKAATEADKLTSNKDPYILDTLARVHFAKGDKAKAVELQKKAIANVKAGEKELKSQLEDVLKEYEGK